MSSKVASEITQTLKAPHHSSNRQQETGSSSGSSISSVEHGSNAKLQSTETAEEDFDSRMKYQLLKVSCTFVISTTNVGHVGLSRTILLSLLLHYLIIMHFPPYIYSVWATVKRIKLQSRGQQ